VQLSASVAVTDTNAITALSGLVLVVTCWTVHNAAVCLVNTTTSLICSVTFTGWRFHCQQAALVTTWRLCTSPVTCTGPTSQKHYTTSTFCLTHPQRQHVRLASVHCVWRRRPWNSLSPSVTSSPSLTCVQKTIESILVWGFFSLLSILLNWMIGVCLFVRWIRMLLPSCSRTAERPQAEWPQAEVHVKSTAPHRLVYCTDVLLGV